MMSSRRPRVVVAGLFHETNTFLEGTTGLTAFQRRYDHALLDCSGDSSPMGGLLETAHRFGWEVIPTIDFRATPSATVADEVVESFWRELAARLPAEFDAIYLVLHGAMASETIDDVEGEILERLRNRVGSSLPIFGVFDLHANFTQRMANRADCLVAYRENPHSDARRAAAIAAELLQRCLTTGRIPKMYWVHPPMVWPPTGTGTASEPMRSLEALARRIENRDPKIWAVSVCAGFSFADTPDTGVSFVVASIGEPLEAQSALDQLVAMAWNRRAEGNVIEPSIASVFDRLDPFPSGLTVLVEPSDNIGAGAGGDGTGLLRAFLDRGVSEAAVAIFDPIAVQQLGSLEIGAKTRLAIGGRSSSLDAGPVELEVELVRFGEGRFALEDPQSHLASMNGDRFDMGRCAVVRHRGITILLTSIRTPPFDLGQWRSQGIEPTRLSWIGVKAAVAHRRAYDPIAARMFWVDTPGPCTSHLGMLPYQKIQRPIYPLDP